MAQSFYKGSEIKFALDIQAEGFSMDDDDFEIEVKSPKGSVKGYKDSSKSQDTDVVIYREGDDSSDSSDSSDEREGQWYFILDTKKLGGEMRVIATAHVPDANANDGIRDEIAVSTLGMLKEP